VGETEAGGALVGGQPELHSKTLSQKKKKKTDRKEKGEKKIMT
jgi:hypothetical protein